MGKLILQLKEKLQSNIKIKTNIISQDVDRTKYIQETIDTLEQKYYALMDFKISFDEFLKYLLSINNEIIFRPELNNIINATNKIKYAMNNDTNNIISLKENFDVELFVFVKRLKKLKEQKNIKMSLYEQIIEKTKKIVNNISEDGSFKQPLDEEAKALVLEQLKYLKCDKLEFLKELLLEDTNAIKRALARKNYKKTKSIIINKQTPNKPIFTNNDDKELFEKAIQIIKNEDELIKTINEDEEIYIEELYNLTNKEEIKNTIEIMNSTESSIKLIVLGINNIIEKTSNENIEQNKDLIKYYIELYEKYNKKREQEQEYIKIYKEEYIKLHSKFEEIYEEIEEDYKNIFEKLSETQKNIILGCEINVEELNDRTISDYDNTLKKVGLDIQFLLLYNTYKNIKKLIEEYKENENEINILKKIDSLKEIIQLYEKYSKAKQNYVESMQTRVPEDEEQIETQKEDKNIVLYLTEDGEITYAQRFIENNEKINSTEFKQLLELIYKLKNDNLQLIHAQAKDVKEQDNKKPKKGMHYKRRLRDGSMRLIFYQIDNSIFEGKHVFLIVIGGKKQSDDTEIYKQANRLNGIIESFIEEFEKLKNASEQEKQQFIEKHKKIEKTFLDSIAPDTKKKGAK